MKKDYNRKEISQMRIDDLVRIKYRTSNIPSEGTIQRKDIHKTIKEMVYQGKSKLEIMTALCNQFPESNCISFFPGWIDDQITKRIKELAKEEDGEER